MNQRTCGVVKLQTPERPRMSPHGAGARRFVRQLVWSGTIATVPEAKFTSGQMLAKVAIFSGLAEGELAFLTQRTVPRRYTAGEIVFSEGESCSGLYVVETGHVRIFKSSVNGREQVLSIDGPGSSIAELPVFDGGNYPASAAAIDDATLLFVSKQDFQALCLAHPQVALKVLRVVGGVSAVWLESSKNFRLPRCDTGLRPSCCAWLRRTVSAQARAWKSPSRSVTRNSRHRLAPYANSFPVIFPTSRRKEC
jgi:hypothetical protein